MYSKLVFCRMDLVITSYSIHYTKLYERLVEIARALATQPRVLLLDEPAAGLGIEDTKRLTGLLRRIAGAGLIVVLVEHDMKVVMSYNFV